MGTPRSQTRVSDALDLDLQGIVGSENQTEQEQQSF